MSNYYPNWWNSTITVYNKYENPTTHKITWYKQILSNCFWKYMNDRVMIGETFIETNYIKCRVPKNDLFRPRAEWYKLTDEDKAKYFTFGIGDIIIEGAVDDVIDEYVSGKRSSDIINKYKDLQGCLTVKRCLVNTGLGRGTEHYSIKGF